MGLIARYSILFGCVAAVCVLLTWLFKGFGGRRCPTANFFKPTSIKPVDVEASPGRAESTITEQPSAQIQLDVLNMNQVQSGQQLPKYPPLIHASTF